MKNFQVRQYLKVIDVKIKHYNKVRIFARRDDILPIKKCVMFHSGRCGSQVLGDLIGQHPDVFWDSEIYTRSHKSWAKHGKKNGDEWSIDPTEYLREQMTRAKTECYGFEVKFYQLRALSKSLEDYIDELQALGFQYYISLIRKNHLRQIVSTIIAAKRGRYHVLRGNVVPSANLLLDVTNDDLTNWLNVIAEDHAMLDELIVRRGLPFLNMSYEKDINDSPKSGYNRVCKILGLRDYQTVEIRYGRTTPGRLATIITNFPEVEDYLRRTPYQWMLYE